MRAYVLYLLADETTPIGISTNRQALYPLKKQIEDNYKKNGYRYIPNMWISEIQITDKVTEFEYY